MVALSNKYILAQRLNTNAPYQNNAVLPCESFALLKQVVKPTSNKPAIIKITQAIVFVKSEQAKLAINFIGCALSGFIKFAPKFITMPFRDTKSKIIIKTPEQIEGIRQSSQLAGNTLKAITPYVKAGVTTGYLNDLAEQFMRDNGAIPATIGYNGYTKASCISVNDVICHGIPGKLELRDGDIVNVDVTTILKGYFGDTSTMFAVGQITEHAQKLIDVTRECIKIGIAQCVPGKRIGDIGYAINKHAVANGYSVVYEFCGHGIGLKFHEEPEICHIDEANTGAVMQPGMIFTVEPMINAGKARAKIDKKDGWTARTIDGKLSAQFEHTILVTPTYAEVLTDVNEEYKKP